MDTSTRPRADDGDGPPGAGPFEGVRIVEIGQYVAAPIAAELLVHGGADAVKIEPVAGDFTRGSDPIRHPDTGAPSDGRQYVVKARGKRAMPVDLGRDEGRDIVRRLIDASDVLVTNLRPGAAERLGLGYDELSARNPGLVYGEISGFGRQGPDALRPSMDLIAQAWTGLRASGGMDGDGHLGQYDVQHCDYVAGLLLAFGIAAALRHREITGLGQRVDTSLAHAGLFLQHRTANLFDSTDAWKRDLVRRRHEGESTTSIDRERRQRLNPDVFFLGEYATSDGLVAIGAIGRQLVKCLTAEFDVVDPRDLPEWSERERRPRLMAAAKAAVADAFAQLTTDDVLRRLDAVGIPASPVRFVEEVLVDPDAHAADLVYTADHPRLGTYTMPSAPISMSRTPYRARRTFADVGEHTDDVLAELGYEPAEIERLAAAGVVIRASTPATD